MNARLPPPPAAVSSTSVAPPTLPPPPPPIAIPRPTRAAPVILQPQHLSDSGSDWKECGLSGTTLRVQILMQPQMMNCGPSALCIMIRHVFPNGTIPSPGLMGSRVRQADAKAAGRTLTIQEAINFASAGTSLADLFKVMQSNYPRLNAVNHDLLQPLSVQIEAQCNWTRPALCHIAWASGGHFTICLGVVGDKLVFADPYFGLVVIRKPALPTSEIIYDTANNSSGKPPATGMIRYAILSNPNP